MELMMKNSLRRVSRPHYTLKYSKSDQQIRKHFKARHPEIKRIPNGKKNPAKEPSLILLVSKHNSPKKFVYSTGKKVQPQYWTGTEAKESLNYPNHTELNSYLRRLLEQISVILKNDPTIEQNDLKQALDKWQGLGCQKDQAPFLTDYMNNRIREIRDKEYRTIQKYQTTLKKIKEFEKKRNTRFTFNDITLEWRNDFVHYVRTRDEKTISDSTLNKDMAIIKKFMKWSASETIVIDGKRQAYHTNRQFENDGFGVRRSKSTKHFLELEELKTLSNFQPKSKIHQLVLDYWLLMAFTGLRVSDIRVLNKDHIKSSEGQTVIDLETFKGRTTKQDTRVVIPLLPEAKKLLEKYDYELPTPLSEQKHNVHIKVIIKDAKIDRIEEHKKSANGKMIKSKVLVADKITNHSARYTFINFMVNDYQIPTMQLSKITGQTEEVLRGYERGNKEKNARKVYDMVLDRMESLESKQKDLEKLQQAMKEKEEKIKELERQLKNRDRGNLQIV